MAEFTHFNDQGHAKMVDVSDKNVTTRTAVAACSLEVTKEIYEAISAKKIKKGDVLSVAQVAGIMAAKNTHQIIPMCHPLSLSGIDINFEWQVELSYVLHITAEVKTKGRTGVEMEALTAANASALTVYDMCKAIDKGMVIKETKLLSKTGGKSGNYTG
jgi:cyclic pyranopterin phosphate synthase